LLIEADHEETSRGNKKGKNGQKWQKEAFAIFARFCLFCFPLPVTSSHLLLKSVLTSGIAGRACYQQGVREP
jgi:hypothetical protein